MSIYLLLGMFATAMGIAVFHIRKSKQEYRDMAFKVDSFEDKIKEAHENLANVVSYQYADVISRLDSLSFDLGAEGLTTTQTKYANMSDDELFRLAKPYVVEKRLASAEVLRDKFGLGYLKAARVLDLLEEDGVIDEKSYSGPRDVLLTLEDLSDEEKKILEDLKTVNLDDLYGDAKEVVISAQKASVSLLQRRLQVGYARAARLLDLLEETGVIGPGEGAKPREVLLTADDLTNVEAKEIKEPGLDNEDDLRDELYEDAKAVVVQARKASAFILQKKLLVGYARAARLLDLLEEKGVIGPDKSPRSREVYVETNANNHEQETENA